MHIEKLGHTVLGFTKIQPAKSRLSKGYRSATVRLQVSGQHEQHSAAFWELVLNHDNENVGGVLIDLSVNEKYLLLLFLKESIIIIEL